MVSRRRIIDDARAVRFLLLSVAVAAVSCRPTNPDAEPARHVLLITIDTLRADHVGAYGARQARTPVLDGLARDGARFERAWAPTPITLPSHASLLSGHYPPAHGARHNGIAMGEKVETLATRFEQAGFATGAFVSAFPLDRRFGLARGFDVYDDELPRSETGRPLNERPGAETVNRAMAWLDARRDARVFLWVHLFEPHAPYGAPESGTSVEARYADEVATADRELGRLLGALGERAKNTLVVATADHGEAFGEHGETGHSIFVYDTTLHVPLVMRGAGIPRGTVVGGDVSLVDLPATIAALTGLQEFQSEGRSLAGAFRGGSIEPRPLYAESFAPLFDFGWAGLRAVREGGWKYIAAPRPELYETGSDPAETTNLVEAEDERARRLDVAVSAWSGAAPSAPSPPADVSARLGALGYVGGARRQLPATERPDPKDRIAVAAQMAMVTSGEVRGDAAVSALRAILQADPGNPQAHLRLGFAELERNRCDQARPHLQAALDAGVPSADAGLGLAECLGRVGDLDGARRALTDALTIEPGNPVALANLGILALEQNRPAEAIQPLRAAVTADPSLLPARFALARALARTGKRDEALTEAQRLLATLPPDAPQRPEVERLVAALR
jgi:arylsulfatase A-like enzyme/Flp pilus assembly protein TadD